MRKLNWCGWVPAVLAACSLAHAEEIGIGVLNGTAATEAAFRQAEPGTLAEEGKTWNFIKPAANAATTVSTLKTAAGVSTEASCAINPGYCASNGIFASGRNRDYLLMDSWAGIRGTENVVISRLPDSMAEYCHVEIYGDCNDSDRDMLYTVNGLTGTIQDRGTFSGAFQEGVNRLTLKYVPVTGGNDYHYGQRGLPDAFRHQCGPPDGSFSRHRDFYGDSFRDHGRFNLRSRPELENLEVRSSHAEHQGRPGYSGHYGRRHGFRHGKA